MQANGGHFNWAAIDREALLGANIVRRRNLHYSGPPAIGQTSDLNSQAEFSSRYLIPAPDILRVASETAVSIIRRRNKFGTNLCCYFGTFPRVYRNSWLRLAYDLLWVVGAAIGAAVETFNATDSG